MRESTDLKDTILREAEELFTVHGFAGTSIKQIATASGCTTAALYYYFPEGKSHLLREVVQCAFSDKANMVAEAGQNATTLTEWLRLFGRAALQSVLEMQRRNSWIDLAMNELSSAEHATLKQHGLLVNQTIAKQISRFVDDDTKATQLAWMIMCAVFGYGQLFLRREMQQVADFDIGVFIETLVSMIGESS
jgi:AcrR family transcriptional regulator